MSVGRLVGRLVGLSVCPWKIGESKNQNSLINFDYLINFGGLIGERVNGGRLIGERGKGDFRGREDL